MILKYAFILILPSKFYFCAGPHIYSGEPETTAACVHPSGAVVSALFSEIANILTGSLFRRHLGYWAKDQGFQISEAASCFAAGALIISYSEGHHLSQADIAAAVLEICILACYCNLSNFDPKHSNRAFVFKMMRPLP